jgi:hypothetical protein
LEGKDFQKAAGLMNQNLHLRAGKVLGRVVGYDLNGIDKSRLGGKSILHGARLGTRIRVNVPEQIPGGFINHVDVQFGNLDIIGGIRGGLDRLACRKGLIIGGGNYGDFRRGSVLGIAIRVFPVIILRAGRKNDHYGCKGEQLASQTHFRALLHKVKG